MSKDRNSQAKSTHTCKWEYVGEEDEALTYRCPLCSREIEWRCEQYHSEEEEEEELATLEQRLTRLKRQVAQLRDEIIIVERDLKALSRRTQRDQKPVLYDLSQPTEFTQDELDQWRL